MGWKIRLTGKGWGEAEQKIPWSKIDWTQSKYPCGSARRGVLIAVTRC